MLPSILRRDMHVFFGTYAKACKEADELLFCAGNEQAVDEACRVAPVGKLLPDYLYVHRSALDATSGRCFEFTRAAAGLPGRSKGANVIKIHRRSGKLSYLIYPEFDNDPHPALLRSICRGEPPRTGRSRAMTTPRAPTRRCCTVRTLSWPRLSAACSSSPV